MKFSDFWKSHPYETPRIEKAAMTDRELGHAREIIKAEFAKGLPAFETIKSLQKAFPKLRDQSSAARVYWTETKKIATQDVVETADEYGFKNYKVVLSPSACPLCRKKTDNGAKIFTGAEVEQTAKSYGHFVPFHPNCYCIVLPYVE